ncbi:hypothetical protein FM038_017215 [Shewanella eurypsychrophilus]|uniref:Uncharacterized protein n=1 Tax=Shewanella eurypsychrophilus TaxID=2593656 RepID=A0ABX6V8H9_9GAMM|nr:MULTISPECIES: hypothetical protein [Shewanella]QFU23740.1 hypothetical protein FS418_19005 [Shewanella sp. YLB-09]QPG58960.1 hypothetical protein FM038_017215 [Shewanella eurypsychrophilus]
MAFELLAQAQAIYGQEPLANDAWQQLEALAAKATGKEKQFIEMSFEALIAAASSEQLALWMGSETSLENEE